MWSAGIRLLAIARISELAKIDAGGPLLRAALVAWADQEKRNGREDRQERICAAR